METELLEIVSIISDLVKSLKILLLLLFFFFCTGSFSVTQGFSQVKYTPGKVAEIICTCEERLIRSKIREGPFTPEEIQHGALREFLIEEDYNAPLLVSLLIMSGSESLVFTFNNLT